MALTESSRIHHITPLLTLVLLASWGGALGRAEEIAPASPPGPSAATATVSQAPGDPEAASGADALAASSRPLVPPDRAKGATVWANRKLAATLPFSDEQDFEDARRGFVATLPEVTIKSDAGITVFSLKDYEFLKQKEAPDSVNPSLWRMAQLNLNNGLFKVTDRIYQVRSFDISNMTIVEGDTGVIIVDPLSATETARAALDLYYQHRGSKPVVAVIYTHSHIDHYAGVRGVISEEDVASGRIPIIAPEGFLEHAVSENVFVGTAMTRRSGYWYGIFLPKGELGHVDSGIGKAYPAGTITLVPPTDIVKSTGESRTVDGVEIQFQIVSGTEAPAEMTLFFPQLRALDSVEIACPLLHNVLTLRGAQVRDAKKWAQSLDEAIALFGNRTDVVFAQHHWPRWGQENVVGFLEDQRDLYAYIHDQTLRLINHGYTGTEIAEMLVLPDSLDKHWYTHGYYGTVSHNVKAVYQRYIGWYDGNPANLHPLPPVETARKMVEYMGGADAVIAKACKDFQAGEYRWVAQAVGQVVFADPKNWEARYLEADALEQLGYQAEAGTWRNAYLVGAYELRNGILKGQGTGSSASPDTARAMSMPLYFDYMGIRLNGEKAAGKRIVLNWVLTYPAPRPEEHYALNLQSSALTHRKEWLAPGADATLTLARTTLDAITLGQTTFEREVAAGRIQVAGSAAKLGELMGLLDTFVPNFNIVTP